MNTFVLFGVVLSFLGVHGYLARIATRLPLEGERSAPGSLWPKPVAWSNSTTQRTLDPVTFVITPNVLNCDVIDDAISRYAAIINLDPNGVIDPALTPMTTLSITIADGNCVPTYFPHYEMDESYTIDITSSGDATMTSGTIWGVLRGLETFSQLIHLSSNKEYRMNVTSITDSPRFPFRGVHVDTSRHFLHVSVLLDILDAMSWDKFNVLHWHVVDDQSFPYPSRTYPELQNQGSYSPYHQYTRTDVDNVIQYARLRGIRVMPEFDTPGHTWSWGRGHPELLTPCWGEGEAGGPYVPNYPYHAEAETINPMLESSYTFMENFFQEIVEDFPDTTVHLGMDEAYYDCWMSNPNISTWMADNGWTEYYQVEQYYDSRVIDSVRAMGANITIWQDPLDNDARVPMDTMITVWKDWFWQEAMLNYTQLGYNTLLSAPWYLNYIDYGDDWRKYYEIEPTSFTNDTALWALVNGGEACMWGEYVDGTNILERLWPRVSAVGERLWSVKEETNTENAKFRLDEHRCRYLRRGFPAQPILNGYCGDYEWQSHTTIQRPADL